MIKSISPKRTSDKHGSGAWLASRGSRKHYGVDYAVWPESIILSGVEGVVSKVGWPYPPSDKEKGHFRYVEITTIDDHKVRYLYVEPCVNVGDEISFDQPIGVAQDLTKVYAGITPHIHLGVMKDGEYINPEVYFKV